MEVLLIYHLKLCNSLLNQEDLLFRSENEKLFLEYYFLWSFLQQVDVTHFMEVGVICDVLLSNRKTLWSMGLN